MSRSGYTDDCDGWDLIRWRGAVTSAIRGRRGQAFLRELLAALDALPEKRLARDAFTLHDGCVCALGAVARQRGIDTTRLDADDVDVPREAGALLNIPRALAAEIMFENDDDFAYRPIDWSEHQDQERRWFRVRTWVLSNITDDKPEDRR